jgi:NAD(P)-dependent dehydrogenase (short-subunit alcohol dehydrogenase family)
MVNKIKTVLITGSSTGIGKASAEYFAQHGWNVAATMRNPSQESPFTQYPNIKLFRLDVTDDVSILQTLNEVQTFFGGIDVIVNNAGYSTIGAFESAGKDQIQRQFDTNLFGIMTIIRSILPYFRSRREGMIINVSSIGGLMTFPIFSVYHATKWALEGFSESLHYELKPFNIKIKLIEPGVIKTDFYSRSQDIFQKDGLDAYNEYVKVVMANTNHGVASAPGPSIVAKEIFRAANDNNFKIRYPIGNLAPLYLFLRRIFPYPWLFKIVRTVLEKGFRV